MKKLFVSVQFLFHLPSASSLFFFSLLFHLFSSLALLSCLVFSFLVLSLFLCLFLFLSPCCVMLCVSLWSWCVFGVLRHGEKNVKKKPVYTFKTPPCVHSKRPRVYRHHAHMYETCGLAAGTHGNVLNVHTEAFWMDTRRGGREGVIIASPAYQNLPT